MFMQIKKIGVVPITDSIRGRGGREVFLKMLHYLFSLFCNFSWSKTKNFKGSQKRDFDIFANKNSVGRVTETKPIFYLASVL
jgi:hypothetical protein